MYVWEKQDWPKFRWDAESLMEPVASARFEQGRLLASMQDIGFDVQLLSELEAMASDVIKTSAIEGEFLNLESVRSSIAQRLGLPDGGLSGPTDRKVDGLVEMMLDVTRNHEVPLTSDRIFGWHAALFPEGYSGLAKIDIGRWRSDVHGPMQVISGNQGRVKVHYEAPPAGQLEREMDRFLTWFNVDSRNLDVIVRAGIAHLWFVSIHPLDDGNGRCARAVADLAVSQGERSGQRFYSMSTQIERDKKTYYDLLESTQKGELDITAWLRWFAGCYRNAVVEAQAVGKRVMNKARFMDRVVSPGLLTPRQEKIVCRLLDGFEGNMTAKKYAAMGRCSQDTASRDINDLIAKGILVKNEGGSKNTSFRIDMPTVELPAHTDDEVEDTSFGM